MILDIFPHLKKRVVDLDDDVKLMYELKFGTEIICLDLQIPTISKAFKVNGGTLFKLCVNKNPINTILSSDLDIGDGKPVEIGSTDYGDFIETSNNVITMYYYSSDLHKYKIDFNEYWNVE